MTRDSHLLLALVLAAAGCSPADRPNRAQTPGDDEVWARLSEEPLLVLGSDPGDPHQQFDRIAGVVRLGDGRIVVADRSRQLRFFDDEGQFLYASGGRGSGPGEFETVDRLKRYRGDSLLVWDIDQVRATVLDDGGVARRVARLEADRRFPPLVLLDDAFADGSLLAMAGPPREEALETGRWAVLTLLRLSAVGSLMHAMGGFPLHKCEAGERNCAAQYRSFRAVWTAGGDRLYYARPDRTEIAVLGLDGMEVGRVTGPPHRDASGIEPAAPAYTALATDPEGRLWAKVGGAGNEWLVFGAAGGYAGRVRMPDRLEVYQIGRGFVLGVERDALDVEHVKLYGLHARGADSARVAGRLR